MKRTRNYILEYTGKTNTKWTKGKTYRPDFQYAKDNPGYGKPFLFVTVCDGGKLVGFYQKDLGGDFNLKKVPNNFTPY